MSVIQKLANMAQRTSVLMGFDSPDSLLSLLQKMLEVSDPPAKVIEDVRAELRARDIGVGNTLRYMLENPPPLTQLRDVPIEDKPGPPPTHLAPMVRLSDLPRTDPLEQELTHVPRFKHDAPDIVGRSTAKISRQPNDRVRLDIDGQPYHYDFGFVQACSLVEDIAAALPPIRWGEGSGPHPGEVVLAQSHPGSRRAAVRSVEGGIALRAVECDGLPAGGSIFLRGEAVDALIDALKIARNRTPPFVIRAPGGDRVPAVLVGLAPAVHQRALGIYNVEHRPGQIPGPDTPYRVNFGPFAGQYLDTYRRLEAKR